MPIDLTKLPEPLTEAAAAGNLVPLIGAGVSKQAKMEGAEPFPTWTGFLYELIDVARREEVLQPDDEAQIKGLVERGKYLMAAQALRDAIAEDVLDYYIRKRFTSTGAQPGPIHRALFKLKAPLIMTTNYDLLLENAYAQEFGHQAEAVTPKNAYRVQHVLKSHRQWRGLPLVFKVHGTASEPHEIVFAEMDYRKLMYSDPGYRAILSAVFVTKVVLMLGFSFSDPEITVVIEALRQGFKDRSSPDYIVLRKDVKGRVEKNRLRRDFGLEVIEYMPSPGEPELLELVEHLASLVPLVG